MTKPVKGMRAFTSHERREIRAWLIKKYGTDCQICRKPINMHSERQDDSFSIDHIIALADGGANTRDNMWPTHIGCNEHKGSVSGGSHRARRPGKRVTQTTDSRLAYSSTSY